MEKQLLSLSFDELAELLRSLGEPSYRAAQIFPQLHRGLSPSQMTNISAATAAAVESAVPWEFPEVRERLVSSVDGTVKYLLGLSDGNCIETVLMRYRHGNTVCVSSQVGCRMGCAFCASTIGGRLRDLCPGEILAQVIVAGRDCGGRVDNIVMMGIGEPLDNYDNVLKFLRLVNDPRGVNIGYRHISLSTCGHADGILRLAGEKLPITLSLSLHAHSDEVRSRIMPVNRKWNIDSVLRACRTYSEATGRRISFEYTLIDGRNCSAADAAALADLLNRYMRAGGRSYPIHVNLIPVNEVRESGLRPPDRRAVEVFRAELEKRGVRATVRRTLGPDIAASCGQLRRRAAEGRD
jgi:23S rRNA (adenine2503-C2)-methyltransferase